MLELEKILNEWNERQQAAILTEFNNKGLRASGSFEKELSGETTVNETNANTKIEGAKHSRWLQDGREPTSPGAPRGNPSLQEIILKWIDDKGINPTDISKVSLSWIISNKIHREGYKQKIDFYKVIETETLKDALNNHYIKEIKTKLWQSLQSQ